MAKTDKKKALLICPHKPSLDPRIAWVANEVSRYYEVLVLGVDNTIGEEETVQYNKYKAITIPISKRLDLVWKFLKIGSKAERMSAQNDINPLAKHQGDENINDAEKKISISDPTLTKRWKLKTLISWWWFFTYVHVSLRSYININRYKPDLVICADLMTLKIGKEIKDRLNCRLVYDAHEFYGFAYKNVSKIQMRRMIQHEKKYIKYVDSAFTVNEYLAKVMENELGYKPIYSLPNASPLESETYVEDDISDIADGRIKFIFQGGFEPGRGIDLLIDAWSKVSVEKCVLFLRGPECPYKEYLVGIAKRSGVLNKNVFFVNSISEDFLIGAAKNADVGIIPYVGDTINNKYACPNKLSQYMQAGIAVLSNDLVFVKNQIQKYNNGIVYNSREEDTLIKAVNKLCSDSELLEKYKNNSKLYAVGDYNWDIQAEEFRKVIMRYVKSE